MIIPTYQRQALLDEAIASVLAQSESDFELIIVDDAGNPPATVPQDPRIRLLRQGQNAGKAAAVNLALGHARGDVVAFLDDDDTWTPSRLATARAAHEETGADVVIIGLQGLLPRASGPSTAVPISQALLESREMLGHMGETTVRRLECVEFNPEYRATQDLEWNLRLRRANLSYAGTQTEEWHFRRHRGPRHLNDRRVRIAASQRLLVDFEDWYRDHPRAHAFRCYRLGVMHLLQGERRRAFGWLMRSVRARPQRYQLRLAGNILLGPMRHKNL